MRAHTTRGALRRLALTAAPLAASLLLAACGGGDGGDLSGMIPTPTPTVTPTPTPTQTTASYNVSSCLNQVIPGTNGATPASLVVPDTVALDFSKPDGFPNGRRLQDPVIDVTLAVLFLDVNATGQSAATFANLPLNPPGNEVPFLTTFPFLSPPNGTPPLATGTGTTFDFRTDPASSFVRVDRMGMPAVATALIGSSLKLTYNDNNPADDAAGAFVPEITTQLTTLTNALADDLISLGLKPCAKPN